jgi:hypothetical protein
MKKIFLSLFCFPFIHSFVQAQDSISVLFIGNSYTYVEQKTHNKSNLNNWYSTI